MDTTTAPAEGTDVAPSTGRRRGVQWWLPAVVLVALPFVVAAAWALLRDGSVLFAGDQALIGLDSDDAIHLDQTVGPYSRYEWAHPGPLWFYVLAPVHWAGGSTGAALVAASLGVHALAAVAVVAVLWRRSSPVVALLGAGITALFVLRMPAAFFTDVWNPFALVLPTIVLLLLAVESVRRPSLSHLLGTALVASFLVQTHIGTLPLAASVGGLTFLGTVWQGRRRTVRRHPLRVGVLATALVAVWVPPVAQQLLAAPGEGNIGRLWTFFTEPAPDAVPHTLTESVTAVGRVLALTPYGWGPGPLEMDVSTLPGSVLLAFSAQAVAASLVVAAGVWLRRPRAAMTGCAVLLALAAAVLSARTATGLLYWYLLVWVSCLPAVTLVGAAQLVGPDPAAEDSAESAAGDRPPGPRTHMSRAALLVSVAVLAAASAFSLARSATAVPDSAGTRAVLALTDGTLVGETAGPVLIDVQEHQLWPIASGLAYALERRGYDVLVSPSVDELFGEDRTSTRTDVPRIVLSVPGARVVPESQLLGVVDTEIERASVYLVP